MIARERLASRDIPGYIGQGDVLSPRSIGCQQKTNPNASFCREVLANMMELLFRLFL